EEPYQLAKIAVRVRITRSAPDDQDRRTRPLAGVHRRGGCDSLGQERGQEWVDAERARHGETNVRKFVARSRHRERDVVLDVTGREEKQRNDDDSRCARGGG